MSFESFPKTLRFQCWQPRLHCCEDLLTERCRRVPGGPVASYSIRVWCSFYQRTWLAVFEMTFCFLGSILHPKGRFLVLYFCFYEYLCVMRLQQSCAVLSEVF